MNTIPLDKVEFHPFSYRDPNGRLFEWEGQLYRGIKGGWASVCQNLFADGVVTRLVEKGLLVETELTPLCMDGFELIVRHRRVPFVSACFEWTPCMLRDAALLFLDLVEELSGAGYGIMDVHPGNIIFDGSKPLYVDFSSVEPMKDPDLPWGPAKEMFSRFFLYPLYLFSIGQGRIARWLLHDLHGGVSEKEFMALYQPSKHPRQWATTEFKRWVKAQLSPHVPPPLRRELRKGVVGLRSLRKEATGTQSRVKTLDALRAEVKSIDLSVNWTEWTDYYSDRFLPLVPSADWTAKEHTVHDVIVRLNPASVLDIGSNRGWFSQLAATHGAQVVAFDMVESSVELLYRDAKEKGLSVLPLVMSVKSPSPGIGLCNQWIPPATDRFKCDLVLANALIHHLALREEFTLDQIAHALSAFSKRWLLVEFVHRDDRWGREMWSERFPDYNIEMFIQSLKKCFRRVDVAPSFPSTREFLLCEK